MYCTKCGKEIPDGSNFCKYCGSPVVPPQVQAPAAAPSPAEQPAPQPQVPPVPQPQVPPAPQPQKSKKRKGWPWVLLAAVLLAGAGAAFSYFVLPGFLDAHDGFEASFQPFSDADVILDEEAPYVDSQLLLTAAPGVSYREVRSLVRGYGGKIVGYISFSNDYQIDFPKGKDYAQLMSAAGELEESSLVDTAVPHYVAELTAAAADYEKDPWTDGADPENGSGSEWTKGLSAGNNWWAEAIGMPEVWESGMKFAEVKTGVIDTMFDTDGPDLKDAFVTVWNDPDDVAGRYEADSKDVRTFHGTHVAGVIGAKAGDGTGITGVSQNARLYGYAMDGDMPDGGEPSSWKSVFQLKCAISLMLNEGVRVINISVGYGDVTSGASQGSKKDLKVLSVYSAAMEDFLQACLDGGHDFLIVKAAGNENGCDAAFDVLGAIEDEAVRDRIIMAGAAEGQGYFYTAAAFSNTGERVDVYAPGVDVLSDLPGGGTGLLSGTSVAAPAVTGTAALIWGAEPGLDAGQVAAILKAAHTPFMSVREAEQLAVPGLGVEDGSREPAGAAAPVLDAGAAVAMASSYKEDGGVYTAEDGILLGAVFCSDSGQDGEVPAAAVHVKDEEGSDAAAEEELTSGTFRFVLPAGAYHVEVSAEGYETFSADVTVKAGEAVQQNGELRPEGHAVSVSDAFFYEGRADLGSGDTHIEYHFPRIEIEGVDTGEVNAEFWGGDEASAGLVRDKRGQKYISLMDLVTYEWSVTGDILSVVTISRYEWGTLSYSVRNISISTGQFVSDDEVLAQAGVIREKFYAMAEETLHKNYSSYLAQYCDGMDEDSAFELIGSVDNDVPFFNSSGHLSMVAFGAPVTADLPFLFLFDLDTQEPFEIPEEEMSIGAGTREPGDVAGPPEEEMSAGAGAQEPEDTAVSPEEAPVVVNAKVEVRDAYTYSGILHSDYGSEYDEPTEYHVPEVIRNGVPLKMVNEKLWDEMYNGIVMQYGTVGKDNYITGVLGLTYDWYVNGDILTIEAYAEWGPEDAAGSNVVYSISISRGTILSTDAVLQEAGVSYLDYRTSLTGVLTSYVNAFYNSHYPDKDSQRNQAMAKTLDDEHVEQSTPFFNAGGHLCAKAYLYDCYAVYESWDLLFDLETGKAFGRQAEYLNTDLLDVSAVKQLSEKGVGGVWDVYVSEPMEAYNQILFNEGSHKFIATSNLLEAFGTVTGSYTEDDQGNICCTIENKNYWGYGDDDVSEVRLKRQGGSLMVTQEIWDMFPKDNDAYEYTGSFTVTETKMEGTVAGDDVRFRDGPSTDYMILNEYDRGRRVTIIGIVEDWYMIEININGSVSTGFMKAEFIHVE